MAKTRMQILIDPEAKRMLEGEAKSRKISVGQVIREAVELYGKEKGMDERQLTNKDALWNIVGLVSSNETNLAEDHDHYLYGTSQGNKPKRR